MVMKQRGFPLTVPAKDSKLQECREQRHSMLIKNKAARSLCKKLCEMKQPQHTP